MMLRISVGHQEAADAVEQAVADVLDAGIHTADIASDKLKAVSTSDMGTAVVEKIDTGVPAGRKHLI
jgi:3-isopropylmalate dehydrogenase